MTSRTDEKGSELLEGKVEDEDELEEGGKGDVRELAGGRRKELRVDERGSRNHLWQPCLDQTRRERLRDSERSWRRERKEAEVELVRFGSGRDFELEKADEKIEEGVDSGR